MNKKVIIASILILIIGMFFVVNSVYAAEKIFGAKMGKDKLAYALGLVNRWLETKGLKFDEDVIRAAIEEQVKHLDIEDWGIVEDEDAPEGEE